MPKIGGRIMNCHLSILDKYIRMEYTMKKLILVLMSILFAITLEAHPQRGGVIVRPIHPPVVIVQPRPIFHPYIAVGGYYSFYPQAYYNTYPYAYPVDPYGHLEIKISEPFQVRIDGGLVGSAKSYSLTPGIHDVIVESCQANVCSELFKDKVNILAGRSVKIRLP